MAEGTDYRHGDSGARSPNGRAIICLCGQTYAHHRFPKHVADMERRERRETQRQQRHEPYYVYVLADPRSGQPFYVGKGTKRRAWQHERVTQDAAAENPAKAATVAAILGCGLRVDVRIIAVFGSDPAAEELAFAFEAACIDIIPHPLTNVSLHSHERWEFVQPRVDALRKKERQDRRARYSKYDSGPVDI